MNVYVTDYVLSFVDDPLARFECGLVCRKWFSRMYKPSSFARVTKERLRQMVSRDIHVFTILVEQGRINIEDYIEHDVREAVADAAAELGSLRLVRAMFEEYCKTNITTFWWDNDRSVSANVLHTAVRYNRIDIVRFLLDEIDIFPVNIGRAMETAAELDHQEMFEMILAHESTTYADSIYTLRNISYEGISKYIQILIDDHRFDRLRNQARDIHHKDPRLMARFFVNKFEGEYI